MTTTRPAWRSPAAVVAAGATTLGTSMVLGGAAVPLGVGLARVVAHPGQWRGWLVAGVGLLLTGAAGLLLARLLARVTRRLLGVTDWADPGWWDARALGWLALSVTVRILVGLLWALLALTGAAMVASPAFVLHGEGVDLGPWHVRDLPASCAAALLGLVLLVLLLCGGRRLVRVDAGVAHSLLVGHEERLARELGAATSSRARIVDAFDAERRRIERDLHDGVQPDLLGVSMTLGLALATMSPDDPARPLVRQAQDQALQTLDHLRRFVRGIHPQVLDDHGLVAAIREVAAQMSIPVVIDDRLGGRLAPQAESTLYYGTAELLSNVTKHADARGASVVLSSEGSLVRVVVSDDGVGGADPAGAGLTGVRDRLAAAGATLDVDSPMGGPTRVIIDLPTSASPRELP